MIGTGNEVPDTPAVGGERCLGRLPGASRNPGTRQIQSLPPRAWKQPGKQARHTVATDVIRAGVGLVTVWNLPGHQRVTRTQVPTRLTARDLRAAADRHPIRDLVQRIEALLPDTRLPYQGRKIPRVA